MKTRKKLRETRKKTRAISPVLAILLMIVITVAASLVTYAWVMGYLSFTTAKAGRAVQIQSIALDNGTLRVYVQNVGEGRVIFGDESFYLEGIQTAAVLTAADGGDYIDEGQTAEFSIAGQGGLEGARIKVKVVDLSGTFTEATGVPYSGSGAGGGGGGNGEPVVTSLKKSITIQTGQVVGTLTNFPMLVSITGDPDLSDPLKTHSSGWDIHFTDDTGAVELSFEVEEFDQGTGTLVAWVKVPSITDGTIIYMLYGDPDITSTEETNPTGVWSNGYLAVYHLNDVPTGTTDDIIDSTGNHHGTSQGGMDGGDQVAGTTFTDGALDFDGSNDCIDTGDDFADNMAEITVEAWINHDNTGDDRAVAKSSSGSGTHASYIWSLGATGTSFRTRIDTASGYSGDVDNTITNNAWHQCVFTYDSADSTELRTYVDGSPGTTKGSGIGGNIDNYANTVIIGENNPYVGGAERPWDGTIDEVRISNVARSAGWIATEYNNMDDPTTFYSLGTEESS